MGRTLAILDNETQTDIELVYDANNNRRQLIRQTTAGSFKTSKVTDYIINNLNQVIETSESLFEYDKAGNLLKETNKKSSETSSYEYYDDGKLKSATNVNNDNCSYTYDCLEQLSTINCTVAGLYTYNYHHNPLFGNKLSSVTYPNGTVVFFIYLPLTSITAIHINSQQTIFFPLVPTSNILEPNLQLIPDLPVTMHNQNLVPLINSGSSNWILDTNNKPISPSQSITSPVDLFATTSYVSNLYQPLTQNLNPSLNYLYDSVSNLYSGGQSFLQPQYEYIGSMISNIPNKVTPLSTPPKSITDKFTSGLNTIQTYYNKYKDPICNTLNYDRSKLLDARLEANLTHHVNQTMLINKRRTIISSVCSGAAAFVHSLLTDKGILQAGLNFGAEVFAPIGYLHNAMQDLCSGKYGLNLGGGILTDALFDKTGISKIPGLLANLAAPFSAPAQCAYGIVEYFAKDFVGGLLEDLWDWAASLDPNDIIGPASFGPDGFIWAKEKFVFRIRFENMENATAPAQVVKVNSAIDEKFDMRSIRFTAYGFNEFVWDFGEAKSSYISQVIPFDQTGVSLENTNEQYEVRVFASIDLTKREIVWQFKTIDINTGNNCL